MRDALVWRDEFVETLRTALTRGYSHAAEAGLTCCGVTAQTNAVWITAYRAWGPKHVGLSFLLRLTTADFERVMFEPRYKDAAAALMGIVERVAADAYRDLAAEGDLTAARICVRRGWVVAP